MRSAALQCSYILNIHIFQTESSSEFQTGFSLEIVSRLSIAKFSKLNPVRNSKLDLVWIYKDLYWIIMMMFKVPFKTANAGERESFGSQ